MVFMMQEDRACDLYLDSLSGIRGLSNPRAVKLHGGKFGLFAARCMGAPEPYVLP